MVDPTRTALDKRALRRSMREQRRALGDRPERSLQIWAHARSLTDVVDAERVLVFETIPGEPETAPFVEWCRANDVAVAVPDDEPDPSWPDVVIVPGLAFTAAGDRLGQGGGWYDRFLADVRPGCRTIGVGFVEQIVDTLPVEVHDIRLDHVVTEAGYVVSDAP